MNCSDCQARLAELSLEEFEPDHLVLVHLQQCDLCSHEKTAFERTLFAVSTLPQPLPSPAASREMWHFCSEHIFHKVEEQRLNKQRSPFQTLSYWLSQQPRWSWAGLFAAFAVFGMVWFMAPSENNPADLDVFPLENQPIALQNPPTLAAGLIDQHSAMAIDPFTDYVGTTLVSYSATTSVPPTVSAPHNSASMNR